MGARNGREDDNNKINIIMEPSQPHRKTRPGVIGLPSYDRPERPNNKRENMEPYQLPHNLNKEDLEFNNRNVYSTVGLLESTW